MEHLLKQFIYNVHKYIYLIQIWGTFYFSAVATLALFPESFEMQIRSWCCIAACISQSELRRTICRVRCLVLSDSLDTKNIMVVSPSDSWPRETYESYYAGQQYIAEYITSIEHMELWNSTSQSECMLPPPFCCSTVYVDIYNSICRNIFTCLSLPASQALNTDIPLLFPAIWNFKPFRSNTE